MITKPVQTKAQEAADRLRRLIARSEELLKEYKAIGRAGSFGAAGIERDLDQARKALRLGGTAVRMAADKLAKHE